MPQSSKQFLVRLAIFLVPVIAFLGYLENRLALVPNDFVQLRDSIEKNISNAELLLAGSSHFYVLNSDHFQLPTANVAYNGQNAEISSLLILKYLDRAPNVKSIVFELAYFSLDHIRAAYGKTPNFYYFKVFGLQGSDSSAFDFLDARFYSWYAMHGPATTLDVIRRDLFSKQSAEKQEQADRTIASIAPPSEETWAQRVRFHDSLVNPEHRPRVMASLSRVLQKAEEKGLQVTFVTTPVTHYYRMHVNPDMLKRFYAGVSEIQANFPASYLNYFEDPRFTNDDFKDADHLNEKGARKFIGILEGDLRTKLKTASK